MDLTFVEFKLVQEALAAYASYLMDRATSLQIAPETIVSDVPELWAVVQRVGEIDAIRRRMGEQYCDRLEALEDEELDVVCEHVTTTDLLARLDAAFDKKVA